MNGVMTLIITIVFFVNEDDFTGVNIDMITCYWHYDYNLKTFTLVFVKEE